MIKIKPEVDDEIFYIGNFIQELQKVQEKYYEDYVQKLIKENKIQGLPEDEIKEWVFEYCFNGWKDGEFKELFSEYLGRFMEVKE